MQINKLSEEKRKMLVEAAKQLFNEGYTTSEVASKLCISESTLRSVKNSIDESNK